MLLITDVIYDKDKHKTYGQFKIIAHAKQAQATKIYLPFTKHQGKNDPFVWTNTSLNKNGFLKK